MGKPSRMMPPPAPSLPAGCGVALVVLPVVGYLALIYYAPFYGLLASVVIGVVASIFIDVSVEERRRMAHLAADRQGESICSFVRSFDFRRVDTWVIRAVFEQLQRYCLYGRKTLPLRASDRIADLLRGTDPEDFEDDVREIARRAGRSLEGCAQNPLYDHVETVADLVMFFVHQPKLASA